MTLTRADALRARLPSYRRRVARAEQIVAEALAVMACPYVSVSGGKDSLVTLDLVRRQRPTVAAIWADDELEHEETVAFVPSLGVTVVSGGSLHAGWFRPWREPPWFRAPLPQMRWIQDEAPDGRLDCWSLTRHDGCFLGLRAAEARHRRIRQARFGALHRVAAGQWRCTPLAGWEVEDVWAYIGERGLAYNPVYDVLARLGLPRAAQRVGPLPLADGWVLRAGWPALYERLLARYGRMWGFA